MTGGLRRWAALGGAVAVLLTTAAISGYTSAVAEGPGDVMVTAAVLSSTDSEPVISDIEAGATTSAESTSAASTSAESTSAEPGPEEATSSEPTAAEPTGTEPTGTEPTEGGSATTEPTADTGSTGPSTTAAPSTSGAQPPTSETTTGTSAPEGGKRAIADAQFTWALNKETSSGSFFGGCNYLVAGEAPNAGSSRVWSAADNFHRTVAGAVTVEKPTAGGGWVQPTFATKCQAGDGTTVTSGNGKNTGTRVRYNSGTGWADTATNQASIRWTGAFTVVYYGGLTYWQAKDPQLTVRADGTASLTATGSGFAASMEDPTLWTAISPRTIELARFTGVTVTATGFTHTPDYLGVATTAAANGPSVPQVPKTGQNEAFWGSFPQTFVDFQAITGQAGYWYTSGGATDAAKPALPVGFTWTLGELVDAPDLTETPTTTPAPPSTVTTTATTTVTASPTSAPAGGPAPGEAFTVADAVLRWGLNNESNNRGFAPGTVNMFSAGRMASTGPSQQVTADRWTAAAGNVRIEKKQPTGGYALATWAGIGTTVDGKALGAPSAGTFTEHQVVLSKGTGSVDPTSNTARIQWKGDFTVVYYSGLTFFYVTDPLLTVSADGSARLSATLGGYGADRNDATTWNKLADRPDVTLATMSGVRVDQALGFTSTPAYSGVKYRASGDTQPQRTDTPYFGAFPQDFVDFQKQTGQSSYWYSTGGATDKYKAALPITVSYSGSNPVAVPNAPGGVAEETAAPAGAQPTNAIRTRPAPVAGAGAPGVVLPELLPSPVIDAGEPGLLESVVAGENAGVVLPSVPPVMLVAQQIEPSATAASPASDRPSETGLWVGGGVALGLALLIGFYGTGFRVQRKH